MKVVSVPNIDTAVDAPMEEGDGTPFDAFRPSPSSSSDYLAREVPDDASSIDASMSDTVEIPTDSVPPITPSKPLKKKRKQKNKHADAEHGDDESAAASSSSSSSSNGEESDGERPPVAGSPSGRDVESAYPPKPRSVAASGDAEIPMEGEQGIPRPGGRLARFKLQRLGPGSRSVFGSRALWGGGNSSFDEESPGDSVELTPLELAKIHASMRRTRGQYVPGIYDRPRNVLEAALIPEEANNSNSQSERSGSNVPPHLSANRRGGVSKSSFDPEDDEEYEELNFEENSLPDQHHNWEDTPPQLPILVPKYPLEELIPFLTLLAKTFHSYGAPVNRTEWNLREVSETLGVTANYSVMPTQITITFGLPEGMDAVSRTFRCDQNLVECGKLYLVETLIDKIRTLNVDLYQARDELAAIITRPPRFSRPVRLLSMALASASAAVLFFNGGWIEFLVSFVLGFIVALLDWLSERVLAFARIEEIVCGLIAAAVAVPVSYYVDGACFSGLVLSALVWLLPGLTLTLSVRELATKNMVAGTVRMFSAFMTSLKLGFGIAFGSYIPFWIPRGTITASCANPLSQWWYIPMFFTTIIPFNVLLDTSLWQWPGQLVTSAVGYIISWAISRYTSLPSELISVLAAFGVGIVGNGYALWTKSSGVVYIVSGILLVRIAKTKAPASLFFLENYFYLISSLLKLILCF